jgi:phosphate transport system substrate-binding protein
MPSLHRYGYLNKSVKALAVGGVQATPETALSKQYPISRPLYMYTDGEPKGEAAGYIRFVLSTAGQQLVAKQGFVPVTSGAAKKASPKGKK